MKLQTIPSPAGGKPLSQRAERVSYCSLNKKLFTIVSFMLFEAQPHALFIVLQPGPTITRSYITVTCSGLRSILCTRHRITQVIQALTGVFIAYL